MSVRRLSFRLGGIAVVTVLATACAFVLFHILRPELFRGRGDIGSLPHYLDRAFLHFDFGRSEQGSQAPVADLIRQGVPADVSLLAGGLVVGLVLGIGGGILCARRPRGCRCRRRSCRGGNRSFRRSTSEGARVANAGAPSRSAVPVSRLVSSHSVEGHPPCAAP